MGIGYSDRLHKCGDIVGEYLRRVGSGRLIRLSGPAQIDRDAGEVLRIVGDLERVTRVIGRQVWDEHQWLAAPLLVVIHRDVADSNLGHVFLLTEVLADGSRSITGSPHSRLEVHPCYNFGRASRPPAGDCFGSIFASLPNVSSWPILLKNPSGTTR